MLSAQYHSTFPISPAELYAWHERPGALPRLMPPWIEWRLVQEPDGLDKTVAVMELRIGRRWLRWKAEHFDVRPGHGFRDRQIEGPFKSWVHTHQFEGGNNGGSSLIDRVDLELPFSAVSEPVAAGVVARQLDRLFFYRHAMVGGDIRQFGTKRPGVGKTVLVTGHTGLIGQSLLPYLRTLGFAVRGLTRSPERVHEFHWDYQTGALDPAALQGVDAVIHLAGENVAGGRWNEARRRRIMESRQKGTALLVRKLCEAPSRANTLISVSGANFYPDDGLPKDELAGRGNGFLSEVCGEWEAAADPARDAGVRVIHPRLGVVLTAQGGALRKMLPAFLAGAGGRIGSGDQHFPWISMDDVVGVMAAALVDERYGGPINVCAPEQATQRQFAEMLGRVLRRPAVVPLPASALKAVFGKMADETLLADLNLVPKQLQALGYQWRQPNLEQALRMTLGRPRRWQIPGGRVRESD